jgi:hypothetical protein
MAIRVGDCSAEGGSRLGCVREKESLPHLSDSFARMRLRSVCVKRNKLRDLRAALEVERARAPRTLWESMRPSYLIGLKTTVRCACRVYVRSQHTAKHKS